MPLRARLTSKRQARQIRLSELLLLATAGFLVSSLPACGEDSKSPVNSGATSTGGASGSSLGGGIGTGGSGDISIGGSDAGSSLTGGSSGTSKVGDGIGGSGFNQCGVAAPLPKNTGQCTTVSTPTIADFDDYCATNRITVQQMIALDTQRGAPVPRQADPNLNADLAIFVIRR